MTQTLSRSYASPENAAEAASQLKRAGFTEIHVVSPPQHPHPHPHTDTDTDTSTNTSTGTDAGTHTEPAAPADDQLHAAVAQGGLRQPHAAAYADRVRQGETLVTVQAPFRYAGLATSILDRYSPSDTGLGDQGYEKAPPDPAAPFSRAIGWPVLSHNPTPLSSWLGWPTLTTSAPLPKPRHDLIDDPAPFSKKIGMPVLAGDPAILSKKFGWRTLWHDPTPFSKLIGWSPLAKQQTPPPKRLGLPLLSGDPAPLSSRFGWKLLSNDPAPFSRLFGWRVLSDDPKK